MEAQHVLRAGATSAALSSALVNALTDPIRAYSLPAPRACRRRHGRVFTIDGRACPPQNVGKRWSIRVRYFVVELFGK